MQARTVLALATLAAVPLAAQRSHQFEFGAFGSFTRYDRAFNLGNQIGGGGRLGYFFGEHVGVELAAGYQSPSAKTGPGSAQLSFGSASLVLNFGTERNLFYLLGGYSRLDFERSAPYRFTDNAVHGALGDRIFLSDRVALRLEVRGLYAPNTQAAFGPSWAGHIVGTLGLSAFLGGEARDLDGDGVADRKDARPGTPAGAIVDAKGCPTDADGDGVYNGLDACPKTPMGAHVDARGCPSDADQDGVSDGIDQCPGTPANATVDAKGCPTDADADGVPDGVDQCPNTPAGAVVDATGCPVDTDKDGVPDGLDKCPNTPPGTEVDTSGCQVSKDSDGDGVDDSKDKCPGTTVGDRVGASACPSLFHTERTQTLLSLHRLLTLGAALALVVAPLTAQRTHSYEFSAFGAWTKYDKAFNLANRVGGGARFGYFFSEVVGLEADVVLQPDYPVGASATTEPLIGAASLIFNIPTGDRMAFYVLGGYSRLDCGTTSPYPVVHGGRDGAVGHH